MTDTEAWGGARCAAGEGLSASLGLLLLLLLAAATTQAAALRGHAPTRTTHTATPPTSEARPAILGRPSGAAPFDLCAVRTRAAPPPPPPPPLNEALDPALQYLPPPEGEANKGEGAASPRVVGAPLPVGCREVGRVGHHTLQCSGANMTQVPDLSLARNVDSLVFLETGIQMVSEARHLPRSVRHLTFTRGPLVTFNGRRLYQIPGLDVLALTHNTLPSWSFVAAFYSHDAPVNASIRVLHLNNNLITYPPDPMGANESVLPLLETLVLSHNPMCNLPGNLFLPLAAANLSTLLLRNCSLAQFYGSPLQPVSGVQVLDLSYNPGLSNTELRDLFLPLQHGRLRELYLANNNYVTAPTMALSLVSHSLQKLDLHGAAFQCLDNTSFPLLPRLNELNLMYCRIAAIRPHTFEVFPVLEVLHLDGNGLITIPTEVLLPTLKVLTLSDNPRSTGDDEAAAFTMDFVDFGPMQHLSNVTFEGVPLGRVEKQFFNDLHGLLDLKLTSCKITYIEPFSFVNLTQLHRLYLNDNSVEVLLNDTFTGLVSLTHLDLSNNKFAFTAAATNTIPVPGPVQTHTGTGNGVSEAETIVSRPLGLLHDIGTWLVQGGGGGIVEVTKRSSPVSQPQHLPFHGLISLQHLDLSHNAIRYLSAVQWQHLQQLTTLYLASNNVQEWYSEVFSNTSRLSVLVLSHNSLSRVTEAMLGDFASPALIAVDLSHNPFQCDCSLTQLNASLNTSLFVDFSTYSCSQEGQDQLIEEYIATVACASSIANVPEEADRDIRAEVVLVAVCVLLSLVTAVTLYRKRWYFRYLVYKVKMNTDHHKEDADHYLYDVFVCYSQADRQWVFEHLVAWLEEGGRYRVCVHERDFTVGQEITENIITAVDRSRKVVVVLSPAFVDSSWCMFELQLASHKILDERKDKLILVVLQVLPSHRQPKKLRFLLRSRTYLAWHSDPEGQHLFWLRLQRALNKPAASETPELTHM